MIPIMPTWLIVIYAVAGGILLGLLIAYLILKAFLRNWEPPRW